MSTKTYQVGGCLPADASTYVKRAVDKKLYDFVIAGYYCYVLNSRQMGKSSLRVQTMKKLQKVGVACAAIDLTLLGTQKVTPEQWYGSLIQNLVNNCELEDKFDVFTWLNQHGNMSPVTLLSTFIEKILLKQISHQIVIFIDEIDSILQLDFKEDFLAFIRACYNRRADNSAYNRLTFVLLGVATPSDFIRDKKRTPFNIGKAIELEGFKLNEVQPLAKGLEGKDSDCETVIKEILDWTGGQPFLTQKVCQLICDSKYFIPAGEEAQWIEKFVKSKIIENWEAQDEPEHLRTIRDRILNNQERARELLLLYQKILQGDEISADNSLEQIELRLSGLVLKKQGKLKIYNRLYASVFDENWVRKVSVELSESSTSLALHEANEKLRGWVSQLEQRTHEITLLSEMSEILQACVTIEEAYSALRELIQPIFPNISGGVLALANLKLRSSLQHQSIHDPLTELFNRRYLEESLERELLRAKRASQPLGIIMLDVDHFKHFNDTFGHEAGDIVLRELGFFLQQSIRGSDIACLYRGDLMILVLLEKSLEVTRQQAEQIREAVKQLQLYHRRQPLGGISMSLGVACYPEHGSTGAALIQAADAVLCRAKREGRDRVVIAS
jgi:diguanylate cyclase (GGDEF)-like protein